MKRLLFAGLSVAALTLTALTPAEASGGCGFYGHRGWDGFCHRNVRAYPVYPVYRYGWHHRWGGYGWHRPWGWRPW